MTGSGCLLNQVPIQSLIVTAIFHENGQRNRRVLDVDGRVGLPDTVLVDRKVLAPYSWNEIPIRVLHYEFQRHGASGRIKMNLGLLFSLFTFEDRRSRPGR